MIAVDTNVLARLLLKDHEGQYRAAVALFSKKQDYTAPPTVMLELVWVLQSRGHARRDIAESLRLLLGLANFKPMQVEALGMALEWYEAGMDFGDALHLALSGSAKGMVSFDRALGRQAKKLGAFPPVANPPI